MSHGKKKIIAILIILLIVFAWFLTLEGIPGTMKPVKDKVQLGLDIKGGVYVVLEAENVGDLSDTELKDLMDRTKAVIEKRVDGMGLANPNVSIEAGNRIRIEMPGVDNAEEAIEQIGRVAQLKFVLADGGFVLDGSSVKDATTGKNPEGAGYAVNLEFDKKGAEAFEKATGKAATGTVKSTYADVDDKAIVIMLDNEIISAPTAKGPIAGGKSVISGSFSQEEASNLAALIRGGSLPVELKEVTSSVQTAKIGVEAFEMSIIAGIIGIILVMIIMFVGYRIMGLAANIALMLYIVLLLMIMAIMGNVLTLPGIAGLILTVGMAVDANVIIFARIKEEITLGRTIRVATRDGYKRALNTVIDAQVTTLIAAVILYQIGTSAVKGFAWTLMIGIIVSIFTSVLVTQLFLNVFAESKTFGKNKFFGIKEDGTASFTMKRDFKFIKHRKKTYIISAVIIAIGILAIGIRGFNYGIDFTGGTMLHIDMSKHVTEEQVKDVMKANDIDTSQMEIVYSGPNKEEVIIKTNQSFDGEERTAIIEDLKKEFNFDDNDVLASEHFGSTIGDELKANAVKAVLLSALGMLIYIRLRFRQWKFGAAALLGTLHDVLIVVAFYAVFNVTVNNPFIAAVLTVVGYSINDTIVIFDRVRENLRYMRKGGTEEIIDKSINQTIGRSIMTSVTTLIVMVPLYIMTSSGIREFILPLMIGVMAGCLSSIYTCSSLLFEFSKGTSHSQYLKKIEKKKAKKEKGKG